jgi:pectin methylesterase-like acyl-CoA thioesterase
MSKQLRRISILCLVLWLSAVNAAMAGTWKDVYVNLVGSMLQTSERTEGVALEFGVAIADDGTQTRVAANDPSANVIVKGIFHDDSHGWTKAQAIIHVDGPVKIGVGNCQYGNQNASYEDGNGNKVEFQTAKNCWNSSNPTENVTFIKYEGGATTLTINGASYTPFFSIEKIKTGIDNEAMSATFPFDQGVEDQKAVFGEMEDFFLSSKVTYGSNLNIHSRSNNSIDHYQTLFNPNEQQKEADESNAIRFMIRPYPGLTFTPTKVSLKSTRFGTDGGNLDFTWVNPDGTTVTLATGEKPERNNVNHYSNFNFDITGATPGEGECGLLINLYGLSNNKQIGFADIVIEGILNGTKQEIPILTSFVANGVTHIVEKEFAIVGDDYVSEIELFKDEKMISEDNPVTDILVKAGELGNITYQGDDSKCTVTIPVTHNGINMKWVTNFVRKPYYTLTYFDADGTTVLGKQQVEKDVAVGSFDIDESKVTVADGYKFRGWATAVSGSTAVKYNTASTFQADANLYALCTPIEVANATARYDYDLTKENFDPADHDVLTFEGTGYWHDKQHGWAFSGNDKIKFQVGGKGYIKLSLCQYSSSGDLTLYAPDGTTVIGTAEAKASSDGANATIQYDGSQGAGELTLTFPNGAIYIHNISIRNQAEDPYTKVEGSNVYVVKQGATPEESGKNLLSMIELANGLEGSERAVIFLPNGLYDLGETVLTTISRNNLSLVGQSMDGTIIKNAPDRSIEGIGTTATILNTSSNLYLQDLTLQNALDYYGAIDGGQVGGRAVCLQDKGKQTICKNVRMLSYQDTYYSNSNSQFYWETSEIHGTVDYLCGGGDVYYNKCTFVNESRAAGSKSGSDVVAAPYPDSSSKFGYVFSHCTIENKAASFSLGRSWGGLSKLTWLNTVINQPEEVIDTRFTLAGMNIAAYSFKEYNSTDTKGNVVSPASLVETFTHNNGNYTYDIILSDEEAEAYTLDKVFSNWAPAGQTVQVAAPTTALYSNGTVSWSRTQEATLYAVFKNGELVGITDYTYLNIDKVEEMKDVLTIRAANAMGGFGEEEQVSVLSTGIDSIGEDTNADVIYNMQGMRVNQADKGVYIINGKKIVVK